MTSLETRSLGFSYDKQQQVLDDISLAITPGSFLAILGVNGCGKSTLMACLDGILSAQAGCVLLDDKDIKAVHREERARSIAFVAQRSHANRLTVYDALLLGRKPHVSSSGPSEHDFDIVEHVIQSLELQDLALRYLDELSGGEYQKVIIGRALVQEPQVLLLDEPTNNLDIANQLEVMSLVRHAVDTAHIAAAAVLHDINLALRYCDRFILLSKGGEIASGSVDTITPEIVEAAYGVKVDILTHKGSKFVIPIDE